MTLKEIIKKSDIHISELHLPDQKGDIIINNPNKIFVIPKNIVDILAENPLDSSLYVKILIDSFGDSHITIHSTELDSKSFNKEVEESHEDPFYLTNKGLKDQIEESNKESKKCFSSYEIKRVKESIKNIAFFCDNEEEFKNLLLIGHNLGLSWKTGESYMAEEHSNSLYYTNVTVNLLAGEGAIFYYYQNNHPEIKIEQASNFIKQNKYFLTL